MHFLGPIRGVLPIGPNGVPAFNTLQRSPFDTNAAAMISYNYTLDYQGFASNISCKYDTQSPIRFAPVTNNTLMVASNGTCDGLADVLTDVKVFVTPNTNNTLTFWACKSVPTGGEQPTYYIYLRGRLNYATAIGNITCALSPIQPAIFPVTYQSSPGIFSSQESKAMFPNTFPGIIEKALIAVGGVVLEAQNVQANLVAESVITFGVKAFQLPPYEPNQQYLRLYEAMLQGIVEYEVCLTTSLPPSFAHWSRSTDHIRSVNIFDDRQPPEVLYSPSDRLGELHGTRLVRGFREYRVLDANDGCQPGFLGCSHYRHVQCSGWPQI
jgi:hypothetical protein